MFQLSKNGERKLLQSLYATLKSQASLAAVAYDEGNYDEVKRIGHSLRGNSGAAYFHLTRVGEIGRQLHNIAELDSSTFSILLSELRQIVELLQEKIESN